MRDNRILALIMVAVVPAFIGLGVASTDPTGEEAWVNPWNFSISAGYIEFEGDEAVDASLITSLHAAYDYSDAWTIEGVLSVIPRLNENFRTQWDTRERVSRLRETAGVDDTSAIGAAVDGLYHFTRWDRLDPYLAVGAGLTWYEDTFDKEIEPSLRAGGGIFYHLSDQWAVRADGRAVLAGTDTEFNMILSGGVTWTPGKRMARKPEGSMDSDGDGMTDDLEAQSGTSPFMADTDEDGLTDPQEIETYKTNPLNPDSDWDGLTDGAEVNKHRTDPLARDTDKGKVADGHEVIEDNTDPLAADDDLEFYELQIQFDEGKWDVMPEYLSDLGVIGKILTDDPGAKARIESHTDRINDESPRTSKRLTAKRAKAVAKHLEEKWKIEARRLDAVGYGFSRLKGPSDPVKGHPESRRIEVYIRRSANAEMKTPVPPVRADKMTEPTVKKPAVKKPAVEKPAVKKPVAKKPAAEVEAAKPEVVKPEDK